MTTSDRPDEQPDATVAAKRIIDSNRYLVLATADGKGRPWACPVWYAHENYASFLWVSRPATRHSRNIAARATVSAVVFDSTAKEADAEAFYLEAVAEELHGAERLPAVAVFSHKARTYGIEEWQVADVTAPAQHRLYRALVSAAFILGPGDRRIPVDLDSNS